MPNKDKELLVKDLYARLPYKPICFKENTNCIILNSVLLEKDVYSFRTGKPTVNDYGQHDYYKTIVLELKPFLRPLSSMTKEEKEELEQKNIRIEVFNAKIVKAYKYYHNIWEQPPLELEDWLVLIDWLNAHHFDYRGLIEKGLALEVPEGMYEN